MMDDNFSCIKEVTKIVQITLPPACTSNVLNGISDVLESWKRQYIQQLQAVVVSFKNVSLASPVGFIKLDYPFILYDVKATFELFYPTVGSIVKGKINRISQDYIGCLVHDTINVTIDRSNYTSDISSIVALDRLILFEITKLYYKRKIIHVKGKITDKCVELMKEFGMFDIHVNDNNNELKDEMLNNNLVSEEMSTDSSYYSPKKSKLNSSPASTVLNSSLELEDSTDTSNLSSSVKKKKRKKSKRDFLTSLLHESLESEINDNELMQPPDSALKKKHKSKLKKSESMNVSANNDLLSCVKREIQTDSSSSHVSSIKSPRRKKNRTSNSPQKNIVPNNTLVQNIGLQNSLDISSLYSVPAENKNHKSKEHVLKNENDHKDLNTSPKKKHKKSVLSPKYSKNTDSSQNVKKELYNNSSIKASQNSNIIPENFNNVYEMMDAFSSFEPEEESLSKVSLNTVKKEPVDEIKRAKKRKHESLDKNSLPKKKRKIEGGTENSSKNKEKKHKKKKKKEKSKNSKKEKKKSKVISTKKKLEGYKNKLKKKKKEKTEKKIKKKKSVKQESKDVPSVKSEIN